MTETERARELIPLYVLGALEGEELREAERLIASGSGEVLSLLRDCEAVTAMLPYSARAAAPPEYLKKKILADIANAAPSYKAPVREPLFARLHPLWLGFGGALASAAIVALVVMNVSLKRSVEEKETAISGLSASISGKDEEIVTLNNLLAAKDAELGTLETKLASLEEVTEFMKDQRIVLVQLEDTMPEVEASGRVLWDKNENDALLYCLNMPEAPEGKTYQWWVVIKGEPRSIGVFRVDSDGNSVVLVDSLKEFGDVEGIELFKVTLEPEGGARAPTGRPLITGHSI